METSIGLSGSPDLANKFAKEAMDLATQEAVVQVNKPVVTAPPAGTVSMCAGYYDSFSEELIMEAEVRELTGADEEAVAKVGNTAKSLMLLLNRAVVSIGDKRATTEMLDSLLAGDREQLLLEIRKATFGNTVELVGPCDSCGADNQTYVIDLTKDVSVKSLDNPINDRVFVLDCKVGPVKVTLPTGKTQKKLVQYIDKTGAELDTLLLKDCVEEINNLPVYDQKQILNLSVADRRKILNEIAERNPGPELSEIKKPCPTCGQEVPLPLSLAELFRG